MAKSSYWRCSVKKVFLEILEMEQENTCVGANFIKKRLQHRCFPVKFETFFRTTNLQTICKAALLSLRESLGRANKSNMMMREDKNELDPHDKALYAMGNLYHFSLSSPLN